MNLRRALFTLTSLEIFLFIVLIAIPSPRNNRIFTSSDPDGYLWSVVYLFILILWTLGWLSIFLEYRHSLRVYAYGWIAGLVYFLFSAPTVESPLVSTLTDIIHFLGGSIITLLVLRSYKIGDWSKEKPVTDHATPQA